MSMSEPKRWLFGLTADEWFHLAAEGPNSEVPPCCGNISEFRENLNALATCQDDPGNPNASLAWLMAGAVLHSWDIVKDDHFDGDPTLETFPLLKRVLAGCRELRPDMIGPTDIRGLPREPSSDPYRSDLK